MKSPSVYAKDRHASFHGAFPHLAPNREPAFAPQTDWSLNGNISSWKYLFLQCEHDWSILKAGLDETLTRNKGK
jgi:hypothetical protein